MPDEESEGFVIRDRRRTVVENTPATEPVKEEPTPTPEELLSPVDGEEEYPDAEDQSLPDVYSVLAMFLSELRSLSWIRMGLVPNPATNEMERDLPQAKIAIDTCAFLAKQIEPVVAPEEIAPLRAMISDLQINFVNQSKQG